MPNDTPKPAAPAKKPAKKKPAAKSAVAYVKPPYKGAPSADALRESFTALKTYDWGSDFGKVPNDRGEMEDRQVRDLLRAIDDAVPASHGDPAARKELETKLAAVLGTGASRAAKDYVCRKLLIIGTSASVPALAALLPNRDLSHMARYALERIPAPEAAEALREALVKTSGAEKAGIAGSLGVRRDAESVSDLSALLGDSDEMVALAAATALGDIGTAASAEALKNATTAAEPVKMRIADARLTAAEKLMAAGDRAAAKTVYTSLLSCPVKSVKLAATRGLLMAKGS
jgi:HEAT repeat protein